MLRYAHTLKGAARAWSSRSRSPSTRTRSRSRSRRMRAPADADCRSGRGGAVLLDRWPSGGRARRTIGRGSRRRRRRGTGSAAARRGSEDPRADLAQGQRRRRVGRTPENAGKSRSRCACGPRWRRWRRSSTGSGRRRCGSVAEEPARPSWAARQLAELLAEQLAPRAARTPSGPRSLERSQRVAEDLRHAAGSLRQRPARRRRALERELRETHEAAERLRLLPASNMFPSLERAAHDAARESWASASSSSQSGGDVRSTATCWSAPRRARSCTPCATRSPTASSCRGRSGRPRQAGARADHAVR